MVQIVQFGDQFAMWCSDYPVPCATQFLKIVPAGAGCSIGSTMQNDIRYDHQRAEGHAIH